MTPRRLRWLMNLWPPFLFAGIRVLSIAGDWRSVRVRLRRRWYNANYVGTHFGGSLFAMTDPFWMILLLHALGRDYIVWDRSADIEFRKAVREDVHARFDLDPATVDAIRQAVAADPDGRATHWFETDVVTAGGELVARVRKQVYVRAKRRG